MKPLVPIFSGVLFLAPAACDRDGGKDRALAERHEEARSSEGFGSLTVDEVAARIGKKGVYLFDNNPRDEWEKGRLPTAAWVDYNAMTAADLPADKDATLIFYCKNER